MVPDVKPVTFPNGERADAKSVAAKVQGMFLEMMLKTMEDSVDAEEGLFGKSAGSEIYRGLFREQLGKALADRLQSPFERQLERQLEQGINKAESPKSHVERGVQKEDHHDDKKLLPVKGPVTSPVGWRHDPFTGEMKYHKGTDIAASYDSPVKAVSGGTVVESGPRGGYGNVVVVETEDGRRMLYGHNQANLVNVGQQVQEGDVIAQVGSTGRDRKSTRLNSSH